MIPYVFYRKLFLPKHIKRWNNRNSPTGMVRATASK